MRRFIIKMIKKILGIETDTQIKYKIGNVKFHNSLIDSLIPQFIEIGDNFISAPGSIILAHDSSLMIFAQKYRIEKTVLGNNVFLGANAVILPGIKITDNVIIGAGAVVTKDIVEGGVYAGNPAKHLSSIEAYISKCEKRGVLFEPPESFKKIWNNVRLDKNDAIEFQELVIKSQNEKH